MTKPSPLILTLLGIIAVVLLYLSLSPPIGADEFEWQLFFDLRAPRVLAAFAAGGLLALCGVIMQSLFRNALAEPAIIGVSGGASLGASLALSLGLGLFWVHTLSFLLAFCATLTAWALSAKRPEHLLILAGVAINSLCASLLSLLLSFSSNEALRNITFWLMGSFSHIDWMSAFILIGSFIVLWFVFVPFARFLNHILLGDAAAFYAGFNLKKNRLLLIALASLGAALVVATCGSVAFIGLMAPHLTRLLLGGNNKTLIRYAPLLGGFLCVFADYVARGIAYPTEIPVGIITSMIGVPFFLWLMQRRGAHV